MCGMPRKPTRSSRAPAMKSRWIWCRHDGEREAFTYVVPNQNQCAGCHVADLKTKSIAPIGPKAQTPEPRLRLRRRAAQNQLAYLEKVGYLAGLPKLPEVPRTANWLDTSQPLEARARAYLEVNCGHCHNPKGAGGHDGAELRRCDRGSIATWGCASRRSRPDAARVITCSTSSRDTRTTRFCRFAWLRKKPA